MNEMAMPRQHRGLLNLQRSAGNRATSNFLRQAHGVVQRKCSSCAGGAHKCAECAQAEEIQRKPANQQTQNHPGSIASVVSAGLGSQTQTLDPTTRRAMESHFGQDFGHVRLHTDGRASDSARQVSALAYTVGSDIVFGSGQYQPHTEEGRRLLAHELTHTIQQQNGAATDQMRIADSGDVGEHEADAAADAMTRGQPVAQRPTNAAVGIARQKAPGPTTPATQPASQPAGSQPAAAPGWAGCTNDHVKDLPGELSDAVSWVQEAIADLEAKDLPRHTSNALGRYLTTDSTDLKTRILPILKLMLTDLKLGPTNFRCHTQEQCVKEITSSSTVLAYSGNPITICDHYFNQGGLDRVTSLIHEAAHNAGLGGDIYEWKWPFPGLDNKTRLTNADSFAAFARSNKYPSVAPLEQEIGPKVSLGVALPGGAGVSPRFLVRVEEDSVLKKRIFKFMDLHLGLGLDFDSSGSLISKASLTTRSFAPLSLTKVPVYLDLGAGAVFGGIAGAGKGFRDLSGTGLNVLGPTAEAGLGIHSGRVGVGISYTHIFNFLKKNPDINEILVSGEILF